MPESDDNTVITQIDKITIYDNKLYVLQKEKQALSVLNMDGSLEYSIRATGEWVGAYWKLTDFYIDEKNDELVLYTDNPYKFMFYDLQGNFKREILLDRLFYEIAYDNGRVVCLNAISEDTKHYISRITQNGKEVLDIEKISFPHYGIGTSFAVGRLMLKSERLNFAKRYDNTIYSLEGNRIVERFKLDFGKNNLPDSLSGPDTEDGALWTGMIKHRYIYSIVNIKETPGRIFFTTNDLGFGVISKTDSSAVHVSRISNVYGISLYEMCLVEDKNNKMFCFYTSVKKIKQKIEFMKLQLPSDLMQKIQAVADEERLMLFLYRSSQ